MPVPILLVTGFLGAGKTTVVNHLLAHAEGRRIAAVVNDFGAINIEWDPNQQMLTARAIAKKGHLPHELLGIFLAYLTERHGRRISSINIQLT